MLHLSTPIRRILTGIGICIVTCLAAVQSYISSGWEPLDAAYMVVITIFGIGYGEVNPIVDPVLKVQTMVLIVVGCLSGLYSCGGFIQLLTEGEINRVFGAQRMSKGIKKMKDHAIICGYGRVGRMLAQRLDADDIECVVIDCSPDRLESAEAAGFSVVAGDASNDAVLEKAGIERARTLASVLPDDASNVFITLTARDLNSVLEIISRAECPTTERKLLRSGADYVVMPAAIGALRMAEIIRTTTTHGSNLASDPTAFASTDSNNLEEEVLEACEELASDPYYPEHEKSHAGFKAPTR